MDRVYCYPDSDVLKNKLNIHDENRLSEAEIKLVSIRLYQLYKKPACGRFDFNHLCRIHRHIFHDIYPWAGKIRTVDIAKGNSLFCPAWNIQGYAGGIFTQFYDHCMDVRDSREEFVRAFSAHYADLNALHPYREGNGRTQREFARELCLKCGYLFDLTRTCRDEMLQGSIESMEKGDNTKLEAIFRKCIVPLHS